MVSLRHIAWPQLGLYMGFYSLIIASSVIGDYILLLPRRRDVFHYAIALSDTAVHGTQGSITWSMLVVFIMGSVPLIRYFQWIVIRDIFLCGLISCLIDADHVIAAKSFDIKNLTSLAKRPFFHNTSLLLFISFVLFLLGWFSSWISSQTNDQMSIFTRLGYLVLVASLTHHIRDAIRRGFNLWPLWLNQTPALPLSLYFAIFLFLPAVIWLLTSRKTLSSFGYLAETKTKNITYSYLNPDLPPMAETIV